MCHPYSGSGCSNKHLNSLLFTYIHMTSGIYRLWEKWHQIRFPDQWTVFMKGARRKAAISEREPKALVLNSNLRTAFLIYLLLCTIATSAFALEKAWIERKRLRMWLESWVRAGVPYLICIYKYIYCKCTNIFVANWKPLWGKRSKELRVV
jgi:hypothetical protein